MTKKEENELKKEILNNIKDKTMNDLNKEIKISIVNQVKEFKDK